MVAADAQALALAREGYARGLAELETALPQCAAPLAPDKVLDGLVWSNFLLAYHGEDDRQLQARYAALVGGVLDRAMPDACTPRAGRRRGERLRVGFLSAFFRDGTVGRYFERWLTDLDRGRFEVVVYHLLPGADPVARRIASRADHFRELPRWPPSRVAPVVRDDALDVLVYPELGMDAATFALAALRLAPLQAAAWGHPVTTGHATIDLFFTPAVMEPADANGHYTERLVRLPGIGTCYAAPEVPAGGTRAAFGLPDGVPLFLCPQSLFKIHPDDDALFARVLRANPHARLVLFEGRHPKLTAAYLARLGAALRAEGVAAEGRLHVLPQCGHADYLRVNTVCDAMLDTTRWSGGNTSLDALASGLPVVTLPGRFMRGRQSAGMLELAAIPELVARDGGDYLRIATRLAADVDWRVSLRDRIRDAQPLLFGDVTPLRAFATALEAEAARG
jgi:CRISPR-associated protein Csy1